VLDDHGKAAQLRDVQHLIIINRCLGCKRKGTQTFLKRSVRHVAIVVNYPVRFKVCSRTIKTPARKPLFRHGVTRSLRRYAKRTNIPPMRFARRSRFVSDTPERHNHDFPSTIEKS
jgi:hypothetical protein